MKGLFFSANVTERGTRRRSADFGALRFRDAVKGRTIDRINTVKVLRQERVLSSANQHEVYDWFAEWAAERLRSFVGPFRLVPIPSSQTTIDQQPTLWAPLKLCEAVVRRLPTATIHPVLKLRVPMTPSLGNKQGNVPALLANMVMCGPAPSDGTAVLVDDAVTMWGHTQVSLLRLAEVGLEVPLGIYASRSLLTVLPDPFDVPDEDYPPIEHETLP